MKVMASSLTEKQAYRVTKAKRELFPRILPPSWTREDDRENASMYRTTFGLYVIAEMEMVDDVLWLHISMSRVGRLPSWEDLRDVKAVIAGPERKAIQVLPPESEYVNVHPHCLHLYVPIDGDPLPDFRAIDSTGRLAI